MAASGNAVIRLQLTGVAQVASGFRSAGKAVGTFNTQVQAYNQQLKEGGKRSFLMNQMLFTMRRYAYAGTLALTGLGTAAMAMGIQFDSSMETNQIAFEQFLGSAQSARKELGFLYNLAKYTPFEFTNVTDAARRFLAFGFTLKQTNQNLKVIGDTVAAFGGGGEQIERMVTVFGQIRASGRLLGQDLLQLEQQGIPVIDILAKKLAKYGVTRAMLSRPGALQIPASIGIPALMQGMQERFAGASAKQAKTLVGQLSTLHDNISQVMGGLMSSVFKQASDSILPGLNKMFGQIGLLSKRQGGKLRLSQIFGIIEKDYPQLKSLIDIFWQLARIAKSFGSVMKDMLPILILFAGILDTILKPIAWLTERFKGNSASARILRGVMVELITVWALLYVWMKKVEVMAFISRHAGFLLRSAWKSLTITGRILIGVLKVMRWSFRAAMNSAPVQKMWGASQLLFRGYIKGAAGAGYASKSFYGRVLRLRIAIRDLYWATKLYVKAVWQAVAAQIRMIATNPITWIVILVGLLVILYFKWKWFHNLVNRTAKFLWKHWKLAALILLGFGGVFVALAFIIAKHWKLVLKILRSIWAFIRPFVMWLIHHWKIVGMVLLGVFAPFIAEIILIIHYWKTIVGWIMRAVHWIKRLVGWIGKIHIPGWVKSVAHGVGSAAGFVASPFVNSNGGGTGGGEFAVAGATAGGGMLPLSASPFQSSITAGKSPKHQIHSTIHTSINIDGKKVAESTSKHRQNKQARR